MEGSITTKDKRTGQLRWMGWRDSRQKTVSKTVGIARMGKDVRRKIQSGKEEEGERCEQVGRKTVRVGWQR